MNAFLQLFEYWFLLFWPFISNSLHLWVVAVCFVFIYKSGLGIKSYSFLFQTIDKRYDIRKYARYWRLSPTILAYFAIPCRLRMDLLLFAREKEESSCVNVDDDNIILTAYERIELVFVKNIIISPKTGSIIILNVNANFIVNLMKVTRWRVFSFFFQRSFYTSRTKKKLKFSKFNFHFFFMVKNVMKRTLYASSLGPMKMYGKHKNENEFLFCMQNFFAYTMRLVTLNILRCEKMARRKRENSIREISIFRFRTETLSILSGWMR